METLRVYLDNLFATLPDTPAVHQAKADLMDSMENRYLELKERGKTENEAVGTVISEFGNIDELKVLFCKEEEPTQAQETDAPEEPAQEAAPAPDLPRVTIERADAYLEGARRSDLLIGAGVFLCIFGPALLVLIGGIAKNDFGAILGLLPLFVGVAIGVAFFIYAGHLMEPYDYLKGDFVAESEMIKWVAEKKAEDSAMNTMAMIIGICLCVLSPLAVILPSVLNNDTIMIVGVFILLMLCACGTFLIIAFGSQNSHFKRLLGEADLDDENWDDARPRTERVHTKSHSGYWPTVTVLYLLVSFIFGHWENSWLIWPIAAILCKPITRYLKSLGH